MKYLPLLILLFGSKIFGQQTLEEYINYALNNNLALEQKEADYRKSLAALGEARGLFYPSVSLNARYTVSKGGRVIDFPVGDLLNPVYSTLNQLTASDNFPVLKNQEIAFLRPTEHETKLRLVQPLFNSDIYYNARIRQLISVSEHISLEQYRRELITEIRKSYYTVAMTSRVIRMLGDTRRILQENIRVNTSLFQNDKITRDIVLRSETELYEFDQKILEASVNYETAKAYFNFLLNRSLKDSIIIEEPIITEMPDNTDDFYIEQALGNREEIRNLEQLNRIYDLSLQLNRGGSLPDLFVVADYGFEGEKYKFNKDHDYIQASAVLTWDLFAGLQNRSRIKQSLIQKESANNRLKEVKSRISLQVINILEELKAERAGLAAAEMRLSAARESFRLVNRRYEEGQASLIEFMDARNSLTRAEENVIITRYSFLSKYADFENAIANSKL